MDAETRVELRRLVEADRGAATPDVVLDLLDRADQLNRVLSYADRCEGSGVSLDGNEIASDIRNEAAGVEVFSKAEREALGVE